MNRLLDEDEEDLRRTDREVTLSTGVILGIFLVLVLLCGAFFGFGYKMGNHTTSAPVATTYAPDNSAQPTSETFSGFKPAAGSPAGSASGPETATDTSGSGEAPAAESAPVAAAPPTRTAAPPVVTTPAAAVPNGVYIVQVAAVSHEEDAQLLVTALKAKGYPVSAHTEPQDKFFHIQVGPFNNPKDALAAKTRLVADGYQPIIK